MLTDLILSVHKRLKQAKWQLRLLPVPEIYLDNKPVYGFLDTDNKILFCAAHQELWYHTLAHEVGHFMQWELQCPTLLNAYSPEDNDIYKQVLYGTRPADDEFRAAVKRYLICEHQAELHAIDLLTQHGVPESAYGPNANAHLLAYVFESVNGKPSPDYRQWMKDGNLPALVKETPEEYFLLFDKLKDILI